MISKIKYSAQKSISFGFSDSLHSGHPLYILTHKIAWETFETNFSKHYCKDNGRPAKPIRLMVGLLILKHLRNLSDESVVEQWSENVYYQYFCGLEEFVSTPPCASSELVHFRKRIGESGMELILQESIRVNGDDSNEPHVNVDTTVQSKNITFPTDSKLQKKVINKCLDIAKKEGLQLRQTYTRTLKRLYVDLRFSKHPKNRKKVNKAKRSIRTIAGRLVRELKRLLPENTEYLDELLLFEKVLSQKRNSKDKIYSLHEPEVCCIFKGKEHQMYEFGNKISIAVTQYTGVIVGAKSFRNEYDGNTLESSLEQVEELKKTKLKTATVDRGYRGQKEVNEIKIQIPKPFSRKQTEYEKRRLRKAHSRRAAIEPVKGHLKADHRLGRNFYKGIMGDSTNILLAAAAYNFKRMMNKWKKSFLRFFATLFSFLQPIQKSRIGFPKIKMNFRMYSQNWAF
jgi:transposase, IS5 family